MRETDLAYAAGLIDGEGCIQVVRQAGKAYAAGYSYRLLLQIGMCDATAPMWMYAMFGGSCHGYDRPEVTHRRVYRWQLADGRAGELLKAILPYLKTKKAQAEIAIAFREMRAEHRRTFKQSFKRGFRKPLALIEAEAVLSEKIKALNNS